MARTGELKNMKDFYWDIRPKPEYGTIEMRVLDTPLTIQKAASMAGLAQCLARWISLDHPFKPAEDDYLPYTFNRFKACRFSLDGTFLDSKIGEHRTLRDDIDIPWPPSPRCTLRARWAGQPAYASGVNDIIFIVTNVY